MKTINSFRGDFAFLSNFFHGAHIIDVYGDKWETVEHFYQSKKTNSINDKNRIFLVWDI